MVKEKVVKWSTMVTILMEENMLSILGIFMVHILDIAFCIHAPTTKKHRHRDGGGEHVPPPIPIFNIATCREIHLLESAKLPCSTGLSLQPPL